MIVHIIMSEDSLFNNSQFLGLFPQSIFGLRIDIFKQAALLIWLLFNKQGDKEIKVGKTISRRK